MSGLQGETQAKSTDRSLAKLLDDANTIVSNAELPEILEYMGFVGYVMEKVQEGKILYTKAESLVFEREKEEGEKRAATDLFNKLLNPAQSVYNKTVKYLRILFENDIKAQVTLGLIGRRKQTNSGFYKEAKQLYNNLLSEPKLLEQSASINIGADKLHGDLQMVLDAEKADQVKDGEKGDVQKATIVRDEALDDLFDWTSRYKKMARLALEDEPQYLEKLGIVVKN